MPDAFDSFPFLVLRRACVRAGTFLALLTGAVPLAAQTQWVATWATAPEPLVSSQSGFNPPSLGLANNSVRQVLRVSLGGDTVRMRFTNEYTNVPVKINAVSIAVSAGAGIIDTATMRFFKFDGRDSVTMPANAYVWSDALPFPLEGGAQLQVTIHFGAGVPAAGTYPGVTVHRGSRTVPRVLAGDQTRARTFTGSVTTAQGQGSWVISSMEVRAPRTAGAVAILGNSITDGYGVANDSFTRWTDVLTTRLLAHGSTRRVGVLNGGIGAGAMLAGGVSTPGLQRYKRDLFDHAGVKWIIIALGVNDIGNAGCSMTTSDNMINAYAQIADSARARGIKVYGATITPFNGNGYYSANSEACRQRINAWVRTTNKYDAVIDFEKVIRNPADTTRILSTYNNDGLHPNIAGYAQMGNSLDTALFLEPETSVRGSLRPAGAADLSVRAGPARGSALLRFSLPHPTRVSFAVYSAEGRRIAGHTPRLFDAGSHVTELKTGSLPPGVYWYEMRGEGIPVVRKRVLAGM